MTIKTSKREWANIDEYQEELNGVGAVLHDLLISSATLTPATISYLLNQMEIVGEYIGNFPTRHPIFKAIAKSENVTEELAARTLSVCLGEQEVISALAANPALSEEYRITLALSTYTPTIEKASA